MIAVTYEMLRPSASNLIASVILKKLGYTIERTDDRCIESPFCKSDLSNHVLFDVQDCVWKSIGTVTAVYPTEQLRSSAACAWEEFGVNYIRRVLYKHGDLYRIVPFISETHAELKEHILRVDVYEEDYFLDLLIRVLSDGKGIEQCCKEIEESLDMEVIRIYKKLLQIGVSKVSKSPCFTGFSEPETPPF